VHEILPVLQVAIGPVILVSGIGLLLLSMTNRFGRIIDRSRVLHRELESASDDAGRARIQAQMRILWRRARLVRRAIALAGLSVLLAAMLIIAIFFAALLRLAVPGLVALLFIACMAALIAALIAFLQDINQSLVALELEWGDEVSRL
jgi:hypothetical protein